MKKLLFAILVLGAVTGILPLSTPQAEAGPCFNRCFTSDTGALCCDRCCERGGSLVCSDRPVCS